MKKILTGLSLVLFAAISAQSYPDYYPTPSGNSAYGTQEDSYYFPDDYYYDYPQDYYTDALYESYYNDYRRSIYDVNWNRFIAKNRLNSWQVRQLMLLNNSFPSFAEWNAFYRHNPDRWYYDRFLALERILGPRVFVTFQNSYYRGASPVAYYRNYRQKYYVTNVYVVPRYRNVNIARYRVDRSTYRREVPQQNFGFQNSPRTGSTGFNQSGSFDNSSIRNNSSGNGLRNNSDGNLNSDNGSRLNIKRNSRDITREVNAAPTPERIKNSNSSGLRGNNGNSGLRNGGQAPAAATSGSAGMRFSGR